MAAKKQPGAVEQDERLIAACGLYCGDCFARRGRIADLARDLRKELRTARFGKVAETMGKVSFFKAFDDYDRCYEVLGAMVKFRCRKSCREGGGDPWCKMRSCARRRGFTGCWECDSFEGCKHILAFTGTFHGEGHIRNLRRLRRKGPTAFVKGKRDW